MKVLTFKGHFSGEYTFPREMREKAASYLLNNIVQAVLLLSGIIGYTVFVFQIGQQSGIPRYTIRNNGCETPMDHNVKNDTLLSTQTEGFSDCSRFDDNELRTYSCRSVKM